MENKEYAICHPDRLSAGRGLCDPCYLREWKKHHIEWDKERELRKHFCKNCDVTIDNTLSHVKYGCYLCSNCYNNRTNERRKIKRQQVIEHYGGKCICCGESYFEFLVFDHINGGGTEHRKKISGGNCTSGTAIVPWIIKNNYPNSIQLLCHNCNAAKELYNLCPHQTIKFKPVVGIW